VTHFDAFLCIITLSVLSEVFL